MRALKRFLAWRRPRADERVESRPPDAEAGRASADRERHDALLANGVAMFRAGDYRRAAELFEQSLELAHDSADAHLNLGIARKRLGLREDAADALAMALHLRPDSAEAHFNLGTLDLEAGAFEAAAARFEEAIRLKPDYADALSNLGLVQFRDLGRLEAAEVTLLRALSIERRSPAALTNLGMLRQEQGRADEALELYDEALHLDPETHEARLNRALVYLAREEFARGWEDYEARRRGSAHFIPRFGRYPDWDGKPAAGRTLLVYGEQGLGDEIMFASCLPDAIAAVGHCVIDCSPKLEPIFRRSFPGTTVHGGPQIADDVAWLAGAPAIDACIPIGSLARYVRPSAETFPLHSGYLKADELKIKRWRERLAQLGGGPKIGLSWRGGTSRTRRDIRSIPVDALLPLFERRDANFVSVQYTDCREELARFGSAHGATIHHWQDAIDDYDETAALVAALDLVVTVQTAVMHLGGALGRPVWVLVPSIPEWRYLDRGDRLPWYPSVRLFRQQEPGDWATPIAAVAAELMRLHERGVSGNGV